VVGGREPVDPLGGGGEQDPVTGLAGADGQSGGEVGLPGAGAEEEERRHELRRGSGPAVQRARSSRRMPGRWSNTNSSRVLRAGNPAGADAELCAPGALRAETSRSKTATRWSFYDQADSGSSRQPGGGVTDPWRLSAVAR
jgi:hypothetical protein